MNRIKPVNSLTEFYEQLQSRFTDGPNDELKEYYHDLSEQKVPEEAEGEDGLQNVPKDTQSDTALQISLFQEYCDILSRQKESEIKKHLLNQSEFPESKFRRSSLELDDVHHLQFSRKEPIKRNIVLYIVKEVLFFVLPCLRWMTKYHQHFCKKLFSDVFAGLTVASMVIPQALSYSLLAEVPAINGLYACLIPVLVYAVLGTSMQLAIGPTALRSMMIASILSGVESMDERIKMALTLEFQAGMFQLILGLCRLGFLVKFLSKPVIAGFLSGAAILIGMSQLKHVVGIEASPPSQLHEQVIGYAKAITTAKWEPSILGGVSFFILLFFKYFYIKLKGKKITLKLIPTKLLVVLACTLIMFLMKVIGNVKVDDEKPYIYNIGILGKIPSGFPIPSVSMLSSLSAGEFFAKFQHSLPLGFIGFLESISVAKFFATKNNYRLDNNKELIALGMVGLVGSIFGSYESTGGLSRSSVNAAAGAKTQLSGFVIFLVMLISVLFLTPVLYYIPKAVLGAVILSAVVNLIDFKEIKHTWRVKKRDFLIFWISFFATLFIGIEIGILIAGGISIFLVFFRMSNPRSAVLGRIPGTIEFRRVSKHKDAITQPGILVYRFDDSLTFVNTETLRENLMKALDKDDYQVYVAILDAGPMNQIDSDGVLGLEELYKDLKKKDILFNISNMRTSIKDLLINKKYLPAEIFHDQTFEATLKAKRYISEQMKNFKNETVLEMDNLTASAQTASEDVVTHESTDENDSDPKPPGLFSQIVSINQDPEEV